MNTQVNFETAKLLKEKGFEGAKSPLWYYKDGTLHETPTKRYEGLKCWNTWDATQGVRWDAPTIAEVVMWLYEKHGIWIYVDGDCRPHIIKDNVDLNHKGQVNRTVLLDGKIKVQYCWDSPTEAYEAAITYILEKLI